MFSTTASSRKNAAVSATIFIVDDDPAVCDALRSLVENLKYPVKTFHSAEAFLEVYTEKQPACLILDVHLPGMSGLQLQEKLLTNKIELPTIMISGHANVSIAVRALRMGAIHFLEKPIHDLEMLNYVQEALLRSFIQFKSHKIINPIDKMVFSEHQKSG